MAELADAADLKSVGWKTVRVQVPLSPTKLSYAIINLTKASLVYLQRQRSFLYKINISHCI